MKFPRKPAAAPDRHVERVSESDISQLLDLSKYEVSKVDRDEFRTRMTENIAAAIVLCTLVAIAAVDVVDLERVQHFVRP